MSGAEGKAGVAAEKARLRERFQAARLALPPETRGAASREIVRRVLELDELAPPEARHAPGALTVGLFAPRTARGEVDVRALGPALRRRAIQTAYPRVAGTGELDWSLASDADLVPGPWGLREPGAEAPRVDPSEIALLVVPGLAFGRDGARLGWGGGYYDRTLARTGALAVGVTFAAALAPTLPMAPHDRRMDLVVTEREVIRCVPA